MDPLTHTLVGAAIARTPAVRELRYAGLVAIVGANLPDIDILSAAAGADASIAFRRGWTHGVLAIAILPLLLAGSVVAYDRWRCARTPGGLPASAAGIVGLAYLATLTHPLLDWLNTYGVRLLMPFGDRWYYGDAVFIVDPWLWLLLGGTVFLSTRRPRVGLWSTLAILSSVIVVVARERLPAVAPFVWLAGLALIGVLHRLETVRRNPTRLVTTGLALVALYLVAMIAASTIVRTQVQRELADRGIDGVRRLMISPQPADPFRWEFVVETGNAYRFGSLATVPRFRFQLDPRLIERPRSSPIVDAALAAPQIQGTLRWMRFPFVEVQSDSDGHTVYLLDARYVKTRTDGFGGVVVELGRDLAPRTR